MPDFEPIENTNETKKHLSPEEVAKNRRDAIRNILAASSLIKPVEPIGTDLAIGEAEGEDDSQSDLVPSLAKDGTSISREAIKSVMMAVPFDTGTVAESHTLEFEDAQLSKRAVDFLTETGYYNESLTPSDLPMLVKNIIIQNPFEKTPKLDYEKMLLLYFENEEYETIAFHLHSSRSSISQSIIKFKKRIIKNNATRALYDDYVAEVAAKPALPKAQPYISTPAEAKPRVELVTDSFIKQLSEELAPLEPDTETSPSDNESYVTLKQAVESSDEVDSEEWLEVARLYIAELAKNRLYDDEAASLWAHIHYGADSSTQNPGYKAESLEYIHAIKTLRPLYETAREKGVFHSAKHLALETFFTKPNGSQSLDEVFDELSRYSGTVTKQQVERQVVLAFAELMQ